MNNKKMFLVTLADSPYKILNADFNADSKEITKAMRTLFRKDPRNGARIGNKAQKMLTDLGERIKVDAFCCEVETPEIDFAGIGSVVGQNSEYMACPAFNNLFVFSDAQPGVHLSSGITIKKDCPSIPFRQDYARLPGEE